jgi:hypothetical protein
MSAFGRCYLGMSIKPTPAALLRRPRFKIGITQRTVGKRWEEIRASAPGLQFPLFSAWGLAPELIEGLLHRAFRRWRRPFTGSGRTEWFSPPRLAAPFFVLAVGLALLLWFILSLALALAAVGGATLAIIHFFA